MKMYVEGLVKLVFDLCSIIIFYSCIDDEFGDTVLSICGSCRLIFILQSSSFRDIR